MGKMAKNGDFWENGDFWVFWENGDFLANTRNSSHTFDLPILNTKTPGLFNL